MSTTQLRWASKISGLLGVVAIFAYGMTGKVRIYGPNGPDGSFFGIAWIGWPSLLCWAASLTFLTLHSARIRKYDDRVRDGLCPRCGYDLRATFDRCPECGRMPTKMVAISDPPPDEPQP